MEMMTPPDACRLFEVATRPPGWEAWFCVLEMNLVLLLLGQALLVGWGMCRSSTASSAD
jgi:hypothetical protein